MLKDGLDIFLEAGEGKAAAQICSGWRAALFSELPDHSLRRYFVHQQKGITALSDTLSLSSGRQPELLGLLTHLRSQYGSYLERGSKAPKAWYPLHDRDLIGAAERMLHRLTAADLASATKAALNQYIRSLLGTTEGECLTFEAIDYLQTLIRALGHVDLRDETVDAALSAINYNHIGYLSGWRERLLALIIELDPAARYQHLKSLQQQLKHSSPNDQIAYHPDWPSLRKMQMGVIKEELKRIKVTADAPAVKIALNLSVAQLAGWVRSFHDEGLLDQANLSEIFRLLARTCRTKRQEQISAASLSKEYYAITQVTAAVNRDLLLKMVARIDRDFFPK